MYVAGKTGSASLDPYRRPGDTTFYGATYPAQTWVDYMKTATNGQDVEKFDPPAYVNSYQQPTYTPAPTQTPQPTAPATPSGTPTATGEPSATPSRRPTPGASASPRR